MVMNWQIIGHKQQLEFLRKQVFSGKLAHAYTFAGPDSVGKKTIARKLAQVLLGDDQSFQPDYLEIDGKEGIKIEQVRDLIYKLSLKPYSGKYKVVVIDQAENFTDEAANALLKLLEEPTSGTLIILITSNPNRLPKTIISRTQKINFGLVAGQELGRPGLVQRLVEDESYRQEQNQIESYFQIFNSSDLPKRLVAAYEIAEWETPQIKNFLESSLYKLQSQLQINADQNLAQKIFQVVKISKFFDQNANKKLLLTNLMLNTQCE